VVDDIDAILGKIDVFEEIPLSLRADRDDAIAGGGKSPVSSPLFLEKGGGSPVIEEQRVDIVEGRHPDRLPPSGYPGIGAVNHVATGSKGPQRFLDPQSLDPGRSVAKIPARPAGEAVGEANVLPGEGGFLVIRPERVLINPDRADTVYDAYIEDVVFQGPLLHIEARVNGKIIKIIKPRNGMILKPGDKVRIGWLQRDVRVVPE